MALMKKKALDRKCKDLALENEELSKDIDELEQLLVSHLPTSKDHPTSKSQSGARKSESKSIWKHGSKGQLHGYKSSASSLSESAINPTKKSGDDRMSVNRSATATKVKSSAAVPNLSHKKDVSHPEPRVPTQKSKVAPDKEKVSRASHGDNGIDVSKSKEKESSNSASGSSEVNTGTSKGPILRAVVKKAHSGQKNDDAKAAKLEKLIKKAGVEEKLKEFKTTNGEPIKHQSQESVVSSKSSSQFNSKRSKDKIPQSAATSKSLQVMKNSEEDSKSNSNQESKSAKKSITVTTKSTTQGESKDRTKGQKQQDSITNQKRKQILSGKQNPKAEIPKAKVCDEEVQKWIEELKLTDTKKYVDIFNEHEINMQSIRLLTRNDLREMGINALGPLNSICNAIDALIKKEKEAEANQQETQGKKKSKMKNQTKGKGKLKTVLVDSEKDGANNVDQADIDPSKSTSSVKKTEDKKKESKQFQSKTKPNKPTFVPPEVPDHIKRSPTPEKREAKKTAARKPLSAPPPKHDSTVMDPKILRRPPSARQSMAMSVAHIALPDEHTGKVEDDAPEMRPTTSVGTRKSSISNKSELDGMLSEMSHQIEALQARADSDPATKQLVELLQSQMQEVQQQISSIGSELPASRPASGVRPKTAGARGPGLVTSALQGNLRPKKSGPVDNEDATNEATDFGSESKPLNAAMSKQSILKEVRKQKDDYRKQIRHLESELSRIKHQDPLSNCEIAESDVLFSDADLIGEGAFSCVYRGNYQGSAVAIKQLKIPLSSQDKNYFAAEVQLLRELRHPRVVLLMGVCTSGRLPLMVLEYMNGGSLYDYLHNPQVAALDHAAYFQIARDISLGMNYLHLHRPSVLHLDMKSMNVLLNQHLRAKIADFGFSKLKHEAEVANQSKVKEGVKGTPAWMAPELLDAKQITAKADVYSFGIVLWEMLTRKQPYHGCSTFQILEKVRNNKRPEIPDQCPVGLSRLIIKCWDQNPGKRFSFKEIVSYLDELHFPNEWRELFKVAGVPASVLEDIQASRTLINIVTHTVEDPIGQTDNYLPSSGSDGQAVEKLDLNFLEPNATFRKMDETRASQAWSELNLYSEQSIQPKEIPANPYNFAIDLNSADIPTAPNVPAPPPLPPVPPPVPSSCTSALSVASTNPLTLLRDIGAASLTGSGISLQATDLLSQKSRLRHHDQQQHQMAVMDEPDGNYRIRASELQEQKDLLKSISVPHPKQLTDLSAVQPERLTGIADLLKKVVNERRVVIETKESLDVSMSESSWSNYED